MSLLGFRVLSAIVAEVVAITDPTSMDQPVGSGLLVLMRRRVVLIGKVTMFKVSRISCFER